MPTYAILGAAGKVGFATSVAVRNGGGSVRAILRNASQAARLRSIGCEIVVVDLRDVDALARALEHADAVQVILPLAVGAENPVKDMQNTIQCLATALERTRPKRILAISDYGAHVSHDIGMPTMFHKFEDRLRRLDGHKVFLRSAEHIENWGRAVPSAIASGVLSSLHHPVDRPFPTISASDLGSIAAQLLLLPIDGQGTQVVHAEGPHRYSASDVAAALSEIHNRTIHAEALPRSRWNDFFGQLMSSSLAELLIKANDAQNKDGLIEVEPGFSEVRYGTTELKEALRALVLS